MHPDTRTIAEHMREFGTHTLGRAVYDATFNELFRPYAHPIAVIQAAHAAEIIIKARIAQEHPLLVFETLPKSTKASDKLTIVELFEYGRTIQYADLPERLWAATGYRILKLDQFSEFGKLRNMIMHFAVPDIDTSKEVLKFAFEVVDPMLQDFWDDSVVGYAEIWDDVIADEEYLQDQLNQAGIKDLTSNTRRIFDKIKQENSDGNSSD